MIDIFVGVGVYVYALYICLILYIYPLTIHIPPPQKKTHKIHHDLLNKQGVKFVSETDTEVIAQLIGQGLDRHLSLRDATEEALKRWVYIYVYISYIF